MSGQIVLIATVATLILVVILVIVAAVILGFLIGSRTAAGPRPKAQTQRKPVKRRKGSRWIEINWAMIGVGLKRFASGLGRIVIAVAKAVRSFLSRLPGWIGRILKWVAAKIAVLISFLLLLGVYGIALALALTALNIGVQTQYAGLAFVEFVKWGLVGVATAIALAATLPMFGVIKRLVS